MKPHVHHRRFAVAVCCLIAGHAFARAELRVAQSDADLGEVRAGKVLKQSFSFVNAGVEAIDIVEARASCGCLVPKLSKRTYQPGESGELTLEINTLSQPTGRNVWPVTLVYRQGDRVAEIPLRVRGKLIREVHVEPSAVTLLAATPISHEIVITDRRERPLSVVDVQSSSSKLLAKIEDVAINGARRRVSKVRVQLAGDCPEGRHDEAIAIYTDDPDYPEFKVPITIVKQPRQRLAASPNRVTLTASSGQAVPSRVVLVRAPESQTVIIERITADHPAVVTSWAPGPAAMATVKITVDRSRMSTNDLQSMIHIHVSKPFQETLSIPLNCNLQ